MVACVAVGGHAREGSTEEVVDSPAMSPKVSGPRAAPSSPQVVTTPCCELQGWAFSWGGRQIKLPDRLGL